jgi:hypothetical protein
VISIYRRATDYSMFIIKIVTNQGNAFMAA